MLGRRKNPFEAIQPVVDSLQLLVVALDIKGTITYVNSFTEQITGYSKKELIGRNWMELLVPHDYSDTIIKVFRQVLENTSSVHFENPVKTKDHQQVFIDWNNIALRDVMGKVTSIISIGSDITKHKQTESLLRASESKSRLHTKMLEGQNKNLEETKLAMTNLLEDARELEESLQEEKKNVEQKVQERTLELEEEKAKLLSAINSVPSGFIITDMDSSIVLANSNLARILNTDNRYWTLRKLQLCLEGTYDVMENYKKCTSERAPQFVDNIVYGTKFLQIYMAPISLTAGQDGTIGVVILVTDVTESKIIERSKDEFFSIASHELRTPLTAIRGNTEILKKLYSDKINDPDFNGMLEDIYASSIRLIDIVNDFLTTSRLEQGKIEFMKESFNLSLLIKSTLKELDHAAQEKHLTLTFDESVRLTHKAIGDKDRVKEVIINLVGNGLKFTDAGGVTVAATLQDKFVKVTIKDTGRGIPEQNKSLLFRKFQQANNNIYARDTARSTGLGLYISKLMIEAMGGTIWLEESEENKGTTFSFTLPADLVSNL